MKISSSPSDDSSSEVIVKSITIDFRLDPSLQFFYWLVRPMAGFLGLTTRIFAKVKSNRNFERLREWLVGKANINKEVPELVSVPGVGQYETCKASIDREAQALFTRRWIREAWHMSPRIFLIEDYFAGDQVGCRRERNVDDPPGTATSILKASICAASGPVQMPANVNLVTEESSEFLLHQKEAGNDIATCESQESKDTSAPRRRLRQSIHRKRRKGRIFRSRRALFRCDRGGKRSRPSVVKWHQPPPPPRPPPCFLYGRNPSPRYYNHTSCIRVKTFRT